MLTLCTANDLKKLGDTLLKQLQQANTVKVLSPELFVVQNYGMARWLSLYVAEQEGIAANMQFKFPAEVFWQIVRVMEPSVDKRLPSEREPMHWALFNILKNDSDPALAILHQYTKSDDASKQSMRRWQLTGRIADVFDQYLTYRPGMLLEWEKNQKVYHTASETWQAVLWRKLIAHWQIADEPGWNHRARLQQKLMHAIEEHTLDASQLPERITVFGVSSMPPVYLKMLVKLSRLTEVAVYTLAGEASADQPLVQSLGETGIEFRSLLEDYMAGEEGLKVHRPERQSAPGSDHPSLFKAFKGELYNNATAASSANADQSIQVHACHSRRREVQVLHDRLLAMMDEDPLLNPCDFMVLAPDIQPYIPEIEATFGTGKQGLPDIGYHLGETNNTADPVNQSLATLVELLQSRFTVTDVLNFLQLEPVKTKFSFSDEHLNTLERWIEDNNIRWGVDGEHKASLGVPETKRFSWQSGLHRMLLGYSMEPREDALYRGIYPYHEIDRSEDAGLAGRFAACMNTLFEARKDAEKPRTLEEWRELLAGWVTAFLPDDETHFRSVQKLREIIAGLKEQTALASFRGDVSFNIIRVWLRNKLKAAGTGGGRPGQGVTFSSLTSMRNIPARVICLLGMNDDAFPTSVQPVAFDLMKSEPQPGDRNHSREERQLFLETMLAAEERLYISYIGKSNRHDTEFPPSVVVREFLDYLTNRFDVTEDELMHRHRLQAFSPDYFEQTGEGKLFSYSMKNRDIARQIMAPESQVFSFVDPESPLPEPDDSFRRLTVKELTSFFRHPAKYLLQNRLGVYLREEQVLDDERESFLLGGLEQYHLGQELLDRYLGDHPPDTYREVALAKDILPDGWPGEEAFNSKAREVKSFGNRLEQMLDQQKLDPVEVDLTIGGFKLAGRLENVYERDQLFYRFGKMRSKELIGLWISHLVLQLVKPADHSGQSCLFAHDKKETLSVHRLPPVNEPVPVLSNLLDLYWQGLRGRLLFFPNTSYTYARQIFENDKSEEQALNSASYQWKNDYTSYDMEGDDNYNKWLIAGANPLETSSLEYIFKANSFSFWKPFFDASKKGEE